MTQRVIDWMQEVRTMKKTTRRTTVTKRFERVQAEAERAVRRGYHATLELLPAGPRKAVKALASQLESTAEELNERGQKMFKAAEKRRKALLGRVEKAVTTVERRSARALTTLEKRGVKLVTNVEQTVAGLVRPVARRLDLAALSEVEELGKRLAQLERKLANGTRRAAA
jgi:hypothetical protein